MRTKAGLLVGSGDHSHKYDIPCPLPPTIFPSMLAEPENMGGRSACREFENNDSLPIQIPRCDTPFEQFKEVRHLTADELRSHVTITLRDKSRYDLIVEMSRSFVGDHVWST